MLDDRFFAEYANTGTKPKGVPDDAPMEKEFYSKAEVDQIITEKLSEAISAMREEQLKVIAETQITPEPQVEESVETDV